VVGSVPNLWSVRDCLYVMGFAVLPFAGWIAAYLFLVLYDRLADLLP
jgi:hypothetical protein